MVKSAVLANQMVKSAVNEYLYDGHNRRIRTIDSKGTSYSMYSQSGKLLYRETAKGGINYIFLGNKLVAKEGTGVTKPNAGENETSIAHYKPFGENLETQRDEVGYTGHKFDTDLGLSYMQARYYDPVIGRFYSNDPVGAATFISEGNIQGFNRYTYANNNPYRYTDPTGESGIEIEKVIMDTKLIENDGDYGKANTETNQELDKVADAMGAGFEIVGAVVAAPVAVAKVVNDASKVPSEIKKEVANQVAAIVIEIATIAMEGQGNAANNDGQISGDRERAKLKTPLSSKKKPRQFFKKFVDMHKATK